MTITHADMHVKFQKCIRSQCLYCTSSFVSQVINWTTLSWCFETRPNRQNAGRNGDEDGWTHVSHRKKNALKMTENTSQVTTFFVSNLLPDPCSNNKLWRLFDKLNMGMFVMLSSLRSEINKRTCLDSLSSKGFLIHTPWGNP